MPDFTWRVQDIAIQGELITARMFNKATHTREWLGVAPTGAVVEFAEYAFHKIRDGRFYRIDWLLDTQAIHEQLGA